MRPIRKIVPPGIVTVMARLALLLVPCLAPAVAQAFSSTNIALDSPVYSYLDKLAGMGLVTSDIKALKPFSKAEVARLALEAEAALEARPEGSDFAAQLIRQVREAAPREVSQRINGNARLPLLDFNPAASLRLRYVWLDGVPRSYNRDVVDQGNQSAFGFIGGDLRPQSGPVILHQSGTEGTPLLENNNGVIHSRGHSGELRWGMEGYLGQRITALIEPSVLADAETAHARLNRGYLKIGGGGLELEIGRDENWFGPGYRGTTVLTNNAQNFDIIKLSSPEPLDVAFVKHYLGNMKYSLIVSRFNETDVGTVNHRQPLFVGLKLSAKPKEWFEYGINFVRQQGGPGFGGKTSIQDEIFGGGTTNHTNTIAGIDLRFRIPQLRNTELYAEYSGEDSALFWPFVESYVAGVFIPCLTASGRDDFRFEYFFGSVMLYTDWKFPRGYVYEGMTPGHSQGGAAQEFYGRYSHWFGVRSNLALEYFYTERGRSYRMPGQVMESKHAGRITWTMPVLGEVDALMGYGIERIGNMNLVEGVDRTNQLIRVELRYRY